MGCSAGSCRGSESGQALLTHCPSARSHYGEAAWPRNRRLQPRIGVQLQASSFFERLAVLATFAVVVTLLAARLFRWERT